MSKMLKNLTQFSDNFAIIGFLVREETKCMIKTPNAKIAIYGTPHGTPSLVGLQNFSEIIMRC